MTHVTDAAPRSTADDGENAVVGGAWLGPAIGSIILTIAWAIYLAPLLIGILALGR